MITLCWVIALGVAFWFGSVPGLLMILTLFVMEGVLELKVLRRQVTTLLATVAVKPMVAVSTAPAADETEDPWIVLLQAHLDREDAWRAH